MQYTINNLPARKDWETQDTATRILQNAKNLLLTHTGEVPYARHRGLDTAVYETNMELLRATILEKAMITMMVEPRVQVLDARCNMNDGFLYIEIDLEIDDDEL
jgi:hypothetical protein